MTKTQLLDVLRAAPFRPFAIHLEDGTVVRVTHPDCVVLTPDRDTAEVAEGRGLRRIRIDQIRQLVRLDKQPSDR